MVKLAGICFTPVHLGMFMRNFLLVGICFIYVVGTAAPEKPISLRRARKGDRHPQLIQRDAIVESVYLQHPQWTSDRLFNEIQPLVEAAGVPALKPGSLRVQLSNLAKEHKMKRSWGGMHPNHTAYLRDLYVQDPSLTPRDALAKFEAAWGKGLEDANRVKTWWRDAYHSHSRKSARTGAAGGPRPSSPTDASLPADWWELGEEFNQYLTSDLSNAADTPTTVPASKRSIGKQGTHPGLKQRNAIVESVLLANPNWTASQIHKAATPMILAAGLHPIGVQYVRKIVGTIAKGRTIQRATYAALKPEHRAFLKAQFDRDPNQLAYDVLANFQAVFGPDTEDPDRVMAWWNNCRRASMRKQARPVRTQGPHSPRPLSPRSVPLAASLSASSPLRLHRSASRESEPPCLPLDWWNIDEALDQFVDTPEVDANGVLLDPWADLTPRFSA